MIQITVYTDIHKFTNLKTPLFNHPAYDKQDDIDSKTFTIPLNITEETLPSFFAEFNRLLLEFKIIERGHSYPNENPAWNDLLYLQYGLKEQWRNPIYSYRELKQSTSEIKRFVDFIAFTEEKLTNKNKIHFTSDDKSFYILPELDDYPALFKKLSEVMLQHFVSSSKVFQSRLTLRKEAITVDNVRKQYETALTFPNELSYNGIIGGIARVMLLNMRKLNLIKTKYKSLGSISEKEGRFIHQYITLMGLDNNSNKISIKPPTTDYQSFRNTLRYNLKNLEKHFER